jgi:hypothetical protein
MMTRNHEKRVGGGTARWKITPHFTELLEMAKNAQGFAPQGLQMLACGR